jgi:hypothetical protein
MDSELQACSERAGQRSVWHRNWDAMGRPADERYFAIRRFARLWAIVVNTAFNWLAFCTL